MDKRDVLNEGESLVLKSKDGAVEREFVIGRFLGRGGSAVCYRAVCTALSGDGTAVPGTLKEFYPYDNDNDHDCAFNITRTRDAADKKKNNQLKLGGKLTNEAFVQARDRYYASMLEVGKIRNSNLNSFERLPEYQIFEGLGDTKEQFYYFWTPFNMEIVPFIDELKRITDETGKNKNKSANLLFILKALRELAAAVQMLHSGAEPVCHLDITPGNFGLKKEDGRVTERVSLFDTNTFTRMSADKIDFAGTSGFRHPLLRSDPVAKTEYDIFSIGACLFYSVVINRDENGGARNILFLEEGEDTDYGKYFSKRYNEISAQIDGSLMFQDCEENEDSSVRKSLADIIKRSLTMQDDVRFLDLSEFITAIDYVIKRLEISQAAKKLSADTVAVREAMQRSYECTAGIHNGVRGLLCDYPLYNYAEDSLYGEDLEPSADAVTESRFDCPVPRAAKNVNILLCGGGLYAGTFIDIASQLLQIEGFYPRFTVVSETPDDDKKRFLEKRKGIEKFFEIDNDSSGFAQYEPYASVEFRKIDFLTDGAVDSFTNESVLRGFIRESDRDFRYVFCAMGKDKLNYSIARTARLVLGEDKDRVFSYVVFGEKDENGKPFCDLENDESCREGSLVPVRVRGDFEASERFRFLQRMAFNIHLLWNGTLSGIKEKKKAFEADRYSADSSMASALALLYRLHSLGITLELDKPESAAAMAQGLLSSSDIVKKTAYYEHRRWNIEKIADGWSVLEEKDYSILKSSNKDSAARRHPCIVHSSIPMGLTAAYWTQNGCAAWNAPDEAQLSALDELDRMSVKLHEHFYKTYKGSDFQQLMRYTDELRAMCSFDKETQNVCEAFAISVAPFLSEDIKKSAISFFKYYKNSFIRILTKKLPPEELRKRTDIIDKISSLLCPVIEAFSFTDYKAKDEDIVKNIPFILTYSDDLSIAAPLDTQDNSPSRLFANAAPLIMINPARVLYFIDYSKKLKPTKVTAALNYVKALAESHELQTGISLRVLHDKKSTDEAVSFTDELKRELGDRAEVLPHLYESTSSEFLGTYLSTRLEGTDSVDAAIKSGELFVAALTAFPEIPSFRFDGEEQSFTAFCEKSRFVSYIPFKPSLFADDLFLARGLRSAYEEPQLGETCCYVWESFFKAADCEVEKSRELKERWDALCSFIKEISPDLLFSIDLSRCDVKNKREFEYKLPRDFKDSIEKLITGFISAELCCEDYQFSYDSSYTVSLKINACDIVDEKIRSLTGNFSLFLIDARKIKVSVTRTELCAFYNNLCITAPEDKREVYNSFFDILERLDEKMIICGKTDNGFVCTSPMVKKLLTDNEFIFRLYVYYKLIETGYFDEVRAEVSFDVGSALEKTIDIIAVKGFRSFVISCRCSADTGELSADVASLAADSKTTVINGTAVLIADTCCDDCRIFESIDDIADELDTVGVFRNDELFSCYSADAVDVGFSVVNKLKSL